MNQKPFFLRRNVFLTKEMVAKIADFGMCTPQSSSIDPVGTPQVFVAVIAYILRDKASFRSEHFFVTSSSDWNSRNRPRQPR